MVEIDTMYGVIHGGFASIGGIRLAHYEVYPSHELTQVLIELSADVVLGTESFEIDDLERRDSLKKTSGLHYWDYINSIWTSRDRQLVHLDDFPTWKKSFDKKLEAQKYARAFDRYLKKSTDPDSLKIRDFTEKIYQAEIESEYIFEIEREEKIIENILKHSPQVVILGQGHGDYMMLKRVEFESKGIFVGSYRQEEVLQRDVAYWAMFDVWGGVLTAKLRPYVEVNDQFVKDRELLIRKYRSVTEGRVMPPQNIPNFIGTWNSENRFQGLFEIYLDQQVQGGMLHGVVEDNLGSANFIGKIDDKKVEFGKYYRPRASAEEAIQNQWVRYEGKRNGSSYEGEFLVNGLVLGRFVMNEGNKLALG